ncbi:MAG: hypothetical protein IJ197_08680 [Bacteroidaceae bacterium]|nr:hypothetical protein [Bacteroidaceae bacterium]
MGLIGGAVGGGIKALGTVFGKIAQRKAMKNIKKSIQQEQAENQAWYDKNYNEDATQRADAQAILTKTADMIRQRNQQAAGSAAVMGGTEESVAATKAANAAAMSDAASQIAIAGQERKDSIDSTYRARKQDINAQLRDLEQKKADNISSAIQGVADAAGNIASSMPW